ncbi:MAG TPA: alpha/beta hydrolase [Lentzea sp.]
MKLSAHDHVGDGPPHLLLHGAGGAKEVWQTVAPQLNGRCVAVDLRGHGESPDGPWEWDAVLDDLEATTVQFGLSNPVVVGHSLGGVLAGMWARRHPDCPAAVSLDGHRAAATDPANYVRYDRLEADLAELDAIFTAQQEMITRPNREITGAWRVSKEFADALPVLAEVTAPFLLVLATKNLPVPPHLIPLMDAHRAGLRRDLPVVCPNVEVREIDATHGMVSEQPAEVAAIVNGFVNAFSRRATG